MTLKDEAQILPLLPLTKGVILPNMEVLLAIETPEARAALASARGAGQTLIVVAKTKTGYAPVGTVVQLIREGKTPQGHDAVVVKGLHRALIGLRRRAPALALGSYQPLPAEGDVLAYLRSAGADEPSFLVALNLGSREQRLALPRSGSVALSTHLDRAGERARGMLELRPDEGLIVRLANGD